MNRNCKRAKYGGSMTNLATGWVGVAENGKDLYFRPNRGSGGFALYGSEEQAKRFTGCPVAREVTLELCICDE